MCGTCTCRARAARANHWVCSTRAARARRYTSAERAQRAMNFSTLDVQRARSARQTLHASAERAQRALNFAPRCGGGAKSLDSKTVICYPIPMFPGYSHFGDAVPRLNNAFADSRAAPSDHSERDLTG